MSRLLYALCLLIVCWQTAVAYAGVETLGCQINLAGDEASPTDIRDLLKSHPAAAVRKCTFYTGLEFYYLLDNPEKDESGICSYSVHEVTRNGSDAAWTYVHPKDEIVMRGFIRKGRCPAFDERGYVGTQGASGQEFLIFANFLGELTKSKSNVDSGLLELSAKAENFPDFRVLKDFLYRHVAERRKLEFLALSKKKSGEADARYRQEYFALNFEGDGDASWYLYCSVVQGRVVAFDFSRAMQ